MASKAEINSLSLAVASFKTQKLEPSSRLLSP